MAQVLHWLFLFSCQPSETFRHGLKHAPLSFSVLIKPTTFNPSHQLSPCHDLAVTPYSEPLHL